MTQITIVGCDLHDRTMLLKTSVGKGDPEQKSFRNDLEGRESMLGYLTQFAQRSSSSRIFFVYEASGQGFGLYDLLTEQGIECFVLSPTHIPQSVKSKKNKTDPKDAMRLLELARAHVLAGNPLPTVWTPPQRVRDDRELIRARLETSDSCSRVKLQILSMLKRYSIRLPDWFVKHRNWTRRFVKWLEEQAEQMDETVRPVLLALVARSETLRLQVLDLEKHIQLLSQTERYKGACDALRKLPGVGLVTAMTYLTEMGDLTRFSNRRQVAAYLGLCPSSFESGESNDRKGHITRQGPGRVRKVLCQAAWAAVRLDKAMHSRWERIQGGKSGRGKKAIVAIMRHLGIVMWHVALASGVSTALQQSQLPPPCWASSQAPQTGFTPSASPSLRPQGCAG
jgi:transposase